MADCGAYYNEFDPGAAAWLRVLIGEGQIAPGLVDERSIKDVQADDLAGFTQCHFFAGIGVWSHALRRAGWPDDRPVWTGSCPCQPFSAAGKGLGFDDARHLWPDWLRLIGQRRPDVIFGEQVASAGQWLDLVSADLENNGFAFGSPDLAAAGFDGAHIRQRAFWVADANNTEWWSDRAPRHFGDGPQAGRVEGYGHPGERGGPIGLANPARRGLAIVGDALEPWSGGHADRGSSHLGLGDPNGEPGERRAGSLFGAQAPFGGAGQFDGDSPHRSPNAGQVDWLWCQDRRWRPVEPGSSPLADASPDRVGRLRGYGNALDAETATSFIAAYLDCAPAERLAA